MRDRAGALKELSTRVFDVLVIGAGITGAGIARDAALRGLSVALVDKGDFGSGTSSRSSRLVHGGVRYLEHGHLHLVFEASAERRRLLQIARHLVRPLAFTWPVYAGQRLPLWKLRAGLLLYDALSLFRNVHRHHRLAAAEVLADEPSLRDAGLRGGVQYYDAATDDTRLTLANVLDARAHHAVVANHLAVTALVESASGLTVARVEDALCGERLEVRARCVVNATGPWSDTVRRMQGGGDGAMVRGSKGTHIAVRRQRVGNHHAITMLHPRDARVLFALPAGASTIIGTTDTFTDQSPDEVRASEADIAYLLEAANAYFPMARLNRDDVVAAWAGIRPLLPVKPGASAASASREHTIVRHNQSVTITGGKLTTYRVMAQQVVDVVQKLLAMPRNRTVTGERGLPGNDIDAKRLPAQDEARFADERFVAHAAQAYGSALPDVLQLCDGARDRVEIAPGLPYRMGEMRWAVERELACTLGDLLIRRTHVAYETRDNGRGAARRVADYVAPTLGWDASAIARELARYDAEVERIFRVDP